MIELYPFTRYIRTEDVYLILRSLRARGYFGDEKKQALLEVLFGIVTGIDFKVFEAVASEEERDIDIMM